MDSALHASAGDDSDNDVVTDFLNSNCAANSTAHPTTNGHGHTLSSSPAPTRNNLPNSTSQRATVESQNYCIPIINAPPVSTNSSSNNNNINNNTISINMIPTINVTPHSPASATKYNNIFEDTLSQLQNIRESVVQMKNSSSSGAHAHDGLATHYSLLNAAILSASLPDLSGGNGALGALGGAGGCSAILNATSGHFLMWSPQQQQYLLNTDRRKSWTAIDDLNAGVGDNTNKSVSLSSLDSEEQETIRVTEQRRRSARNSTGGISTHSLNEAELARDFERIAAKRSLATEIISRIPLQKSISTSSIVAKEEIKAIARHLTDSEDENQSLLRAHTKIEVYDNVEKRRKRGSLFFRKKKDKTKMKASNASAAGGVGVGGASSAMGGATQCDACGSIITPLASVKEHQLECKASGGGKRHSSSGGSKKSGGGDGDFLDGITGNDHHHHHHQHHHQLSGGGGGAYNDDASTPLIRSEFLNDPPIEAHDLGADPSLGIALEEHDSWSPSVPKELLKSLKEKQIKRQEHIYEFIMTEKSHCQTLLVMQKVFVDSLERHFPALNTARMFPRLLELSELHLAFLKRLRQKQREQYVVDSIADILLEFFSLEKAQHLRLAYGEFCANHRSALEQFKACMTSRDQTFAEWYKHCLANPLLKKKGIPECILFVTQRLTKYPLLIEPLLKSGREDKLETDKLQHALSLVKALLVDVDACVAERELRERQLDICQRIDAKSFAIYKNKPFRRADVAVESRRRLKFEGLATLMQGRSKMQLVMVVVLTDCLCFLSENSAHNKYTFFTPEHKAGVVPLQKLLIREKAGTESRGIYIISSNPAFPEMYELKVQQPKDKNAWIQSIRQAVLDCPSTDVIEAEDLTAEEKLRIGVNRRELIEKMRQKDIEQALLLEEKLMLQMNLLKEQQAFGELPTSSSPSAAVAGPGGDGAGGVGGGISAANFLAALGSYKDLCNVDCDTAELWRRVLNTVQDISQLAATVYTAATGLPVSRSVSSVGERQSDTYASPTLPKRAETFAGFDERRAKLPTMTVLSPRLQELEEKPAGPPTAEQLALKDQHYATLQVSHHLHTLLCIISQQMTTVHSLQLQLALYREHPRTVYTHNDQLEELRNLQDKLQEEKTAWQRQREHQEQELEEKRVAQTKMLEQIKHEEEDIKQQREQLFRKMELLSNQGLLLSPNTPLMIGSPPLPGSAGSGQQQDDSHDGHERDGADGVAAVTVDRRREGNNKWRTASTISKTPPVHLLSANNAPKVSQNNVKQKLPMKLSSLSSATSVSAGSGGSGSGSGGTSKIDKSASFNVSGTSAATAAASSSASGITQLFPLKLADKRATAAAAAAMAATSPLVPQHSRTGSSPAIIQQHPTTPTTSTPSTVVGVTRTESASTYTYGQRTAGAGGKSAQVANSRKASSASANKADEEEIYF